jgi:hypothetical protein
MTVSYNTIYYFTGIQLFVKNTANRFGFIQNNINNFIHPITLFDLEFVKDSVVVLQTNIDIISTDNKYDNMDYDFIIHNDNSNTSHETIVNKTIFYEIPKIKIFKPLCYKFIMTKLITHTGIAVEIQLFSDKSNYFVLNNVITKKVILYLLKTNHPDVVLSVNDLKDYKLMIIDQNANLLYVQHNQSISFGKHNYDILDIQTEIDISVIDN